MRKFIGAAMVAALLSGCASSSRGTGGYYGYTPTYAYTPTYMQTYVPLPAPVYSGGGGFSSDIEDRLDDIEDRLDDIEMQQMLNDD